MHAARDVPNLGTDLWLAERSTGIPDARHPRQLGHRGNAGARAIAQFDMSTLVRTWEKNWRPGLLQHHHNLTDDATGCFCTRGAGVCARHGRGAGKCMGYVPGSCWHHG